MGKPKTAPQKPKAASLKSKEEQKPKAAPSEKKKQEQKPKAAPLKKQKPKAAPLKKQEPKDVPLEKQKPKKELPKDVPLKEQEPKTKSPEKQKPLQSRIKKPLSGVKDFKPLKVQKVSSDTQKRFITIPDSEILAENESRLSDQKRRTLYVALPGNARKISDSALMALHPDILNVNRTSGAAFLTFASEMVRDKAFPIIKKARIKNHPLTTVDYCCEKSKNCKPKVSTPAHGINSTQLVVSDIPKSTTTNMLEIIFPKANDLKVINKRNIAYVNFANEEDCTEAFKKGKKLKISSVPVVVRHRFAADTESFKKHGDENAIPSKSAPKSNPSPNKKRLEKSIVESSDEEMDQTEHEGEDEYEEISTYEEVEVEDSDFEE